MDAFKLLADDCRKISELLDDIQSTENRNAKEDLFQEVKNLFELHTQLENRILYPALQPAAESGALSFEAMQEDEQEMRELLAELDAISPDEDEEWKDLIQELSDEVEHHASDEEELFDKARAVLSPEQIDELGNRMLAEKQKSLSAGMS